MNKDAIVSGTIYALHNGDGEIRYIGLTSQHPDARLRGHIREAKYDDKNPHKRRWILKHQSTLQIEILEHYPDICYRDLMKLEIIRIAKAKEEGLRLLNVSNGGEGGHGYKHTPEARKKMSIAASARVGRYVSPETAEKIRVAQLGKFIPMEQRAKMSAARKGKPAHNKGIAHSEEQKAKLSVSSHNRWHTERDIIKDGCIHCASAQQKVA